MRAKEYGENQSALARDAGVSQKTISNILSANGQKSDAELNEIPAPSIVVVEKLAVALNLFPWQLLHPDPAQAQREMDFYRKVEENYRQLPKRERDQFGGIKLGEFEPAQDFTNEPAKRK